MKLIDNKKGYNIYECTKKECKKFYQVYPSFAVFYEEMERVRKQDFEGIAEFEYIFVNDGSKDNTLKIMKELNSKDNKVRYVSFSRNFGKDAALDAGLDAAEGE